MRVAAKIAVFLVVALSGFLVNADAQNSQASLPPAAENTPLEIQTQIDNQAERIKRLQKMHNLRFADLVSRSRETQADVDLIHSVLKAIAFFILVSFGLLAYLIKNALKDTRRDCDYASLNKKVACALQDFETRLARLGDLKMTKADIEELLRWRTTLIQDLEALDRRIRQIEALNPTPPDTTSVGLATFSTFANATRANIDNLFNKVAELLPLNNPDAPLRIALQLELSILREAWQKFSDNNTEVFALLERAKTMQVEELRGALLSQLPPLVPDDLKPTFDTVVAPARDFQNLVAKIALIQPILNDKLPALFNEHQAILRARECINLLTMIQNSNLVADRLNFRLERWVEDQFLGFADLYLQKYQTDQLENNENRLEPGWRIVCQILEVADLKPVDLTLGVTPFDSTRHIGRSTTCDSNFANGVIVGVVRNGFLRGGQPLRQPEVIVNRVG